MSIRRKEISTASHGHPLGPHQRQTSAFHPHGCAVCPFSSFLRFVRGFASFACAEGRTPCPSAQAQSNAPNNICRGSWASIGPTPKADICVSSSRLRRAPIFLLFCFLLGDLLALPVLRLRGEHLAPALKRKAMPRTTFVAALGHPLGPHQRQTSAFHPHGCAVRPFSSFFAFC